MVMMMVMTMYKYDDMVIWFVSDAHIISFRIISYLKFKLSKNTIFCQDNVRLMHIYLANYHPIIIIIFPLLHKQFVNAFKKY